MSEISLYASRKSTLCRSRYFHDGARPKPASSIDIVILPEMITLEDDQSFLYFNNTDKEK